jgi:hypothetical protein
MANPGRIGAPLLLVLALTPAVFTQEPAQDSRVNPQAKILQDFQSGIEEYMEVHKAAAKQVPKLKETEDPAKIKSVQDALAAGIRAARPNARQGEIFTPEIARHLRGLMSPEVKGARGAETKQAINDEQPASIRLKVNAHYPDDEPLPTVPPNLLASLPKLPEELEYRVVRNHLILRDIPANLIVDFIPNAIR